jgi:threonine/homoserine/homoserine lactone efflux protein
VQVSLGNPSEVEMSVAFLLTSLVIVATPGTGALYTISAGVSGGARRSLTAAVGCTLGIVPRLVAAVTGTAAVLHASGLACAVVKFLGVAYLLFMAWSTWRDRSVSTVEDQSSSKSAWNVIGSAVLIHLLNPKRTLFFLPSCRSSFQATPEGSWAPCSRSAAFLLR